MYVSMGFDIILKKDEIPLLKEFFVYLQISKFTRNGSKYQKRWLPICGVLYLTLEKVTPLTVECRSARYNNSIRYKLLIINE